MMFTGICPQCSRELSQSQLLNGGAVCSCGWTDTTLALKADKAAEKHSIKIMLGMAFVLVAMYAHLLNWGSYAVEIPFVKVAEFTGLLSKEGYQELADVCVTLNKWDCAKDALTELYTVKHDVAGIAARARLESRLGESQAALKTYSVYVAAGGKELNALNYYGDLLEQTGRHEEAFKVYELSIANSGQFLPVKATSGLISLLMKQGRYEEAMARIKAFHATAENATGYFNTEETQLENYLGKQAKASGNSKTKSNRGA